MTKSRFSEVQVVGLKEVEMGAKVGETCRKHGVSEPTYYKWKSQFSGMTVSHLAQLRQLQDENAQPTPRLRAAVRQRPSSRQALGQGGALALVLQAAVESATAGQEAAASTHQTALGSCRSAQPWLEMRLHVRCVVVRQAV